MPEERPAEPAGLGAARLPRPLRRSPGRGSRGDGAGRAARPARQPAEGRRARRPPPRWPPRGIETEPTRWSPWGLRLPSRRPVTADQGLHRGADRGAGRGQPADRPADRCQARAARGRPLRRGGGQDPGAGGDHAEQGPHHRLRRQRRRGWKGRSAGSAAPGWTMPSGTCSSPATAGRSAGPGSSTGSWSMHPVRVQALGGATRTRGSVPVPRTSRNCAPSKVKFWTSRRNWCVPAGVWSTLPVRCCPRRMRTRCPTSSTATRISPRCPWPKPGQRRAMPGDPPAEGNVPGHQPGAAWHGRLLRRRLATQVLRAGAQPGKGKRAA